LKKIYYAVNSFVRFDNHTIFGRNSPPFKNPDNLTLFSQEPETLSYHEALKSNPT